MNAITEFEPAGASFEAIYEFLAEARKQSPIFFSQKHQGWVLTRYDDIAAVARHPNFTVRNALQAAQGGQYCAEATRILSRGVDWNRTKHIQTEDGPNHQRFRQAMLGVVTPQRIREMEPVIARIVDQLIDRFIARGSCEYVHELAYPLAMGTTLNLVGFTEIEGDMDKFSLWVNDTFRLLLANLSDEEQIAAATNAVAFQDYIREKIAARRDIKDDRLAAVIDYLQNGPAKITDDEMVIMFTHSFVGAGHETTKLALTNSIYHLLSVRERWEALVAAPGRVGEFVEECLRYDAPLLAWYRYCDEDTEIGGQMIRTGDQVIMVFGSANHDEAKFSDPESFCPFRGEKIQHMTFNSGKHFCIGAPLARLELNSALATLARRIPSLRLRPGQEISYQANFGNRVIPQLWLEWDA